MDYLEFRTTWPSGLNPAVNAASSVVGIVSLLFFLEALVAKKIVSRMHFK
jgi:hypothetical protein